MKLNKIHMKNRDINNDHVNDNNDRKGFNKQLQKNATLIFENVTKQSRSKIQLEKLTFSLSCYNHYMRLLLLLLLFEICLINSIC